MQVRHIPTFKIPNRLALGDGYFRQDDAVQKSSSMINKADDKIGLIYARFGICEKYLTMPSMLHVQTALKCHLDCFSPLTSLDSDMLQDCFQDSPHSLTTLNPPLPPGFPSLFLRMPFTCGVPTPPVCLLASLNLPLSISCLPESVTRWCPAIVSAGALKRLSTALFKVPRRVSPAPCHQSY